MAMFPTSIWSGTGTYPRDKSVQKLLDRYVSCIMLDGYVPLHINVSSTIELRSETNNRYCSWSHNLSIYFLFIRSFIHSFVFLFLNLFVFLFVYLLSPHQW